MSIHENLSCLSVEDLKWSCSADWNLIKEGLQLKNLLDNLDSDYLAEIVLAFYGGGILENSRFRQMLLSKLPAKKLSDLAAENTDKLFKEAGVNARNLANLRWSTNSPLVRIFSDELKVEGEFLPSSPVRTPMVEEVDPHDLLPPTFKYQEEIVNRALEALSESPTRFLIQLPTGSGKTRIMMEILVRLRELEFEQGKETTIVWLAHSTELLEQAIDTLKTVWGYKGSGRARIVRLFGSYALKGTELTNTFIFASLQKFGHLDAKPHNLINKISENLSLIVIDEAHKISAPSYLKALNLLTNDKTSVVGVTATPGRSVFDGRQNRNLAAIFKGRLLKPNLGANPIKTLRNMGVLSEVVHIEIQTGLRFDFEFNEDELEIDFTNRSIKGIAESSERNQIIAETIKSEVELGNPVIVFSCNVEHSKMLCALLAVGGVKSSYIDHTKSYGARKKTISDFRGGVLDVIVNYGVLSTGFDAPRIRTVVVTRPTTSIVLYSQMIGRGLRGEAVGGNKYCRVIDINDNFERYGDLEKVYSHFSEFWA